MSPTTTGARARRMTLPQRESRPRSQRAETTHVSAAAGRHNPRSATSEPATPATRYIQTGEKGIKVDDLLNAVRDEFNENEDLPNTTNPDDWAKIAGKKGERIVYVKPLTGEPKQKRQDIERVVTTGQYL